jgi:hypothetical protein
MPTRNVLDALDVSESYPPANGTNSGAKSSLVQLPVEILLRITRHLTTVELGNVRLTCRALERATFNSFSHEFFRKKQFMATSFSLQALVDISKHPTLSPYLKHVIISTHRPCLAQEIARFGPTEEQVHNTLLANADHMHLLSTGVLRDMLAEAFSNLRNLETVDIRNFNSRTRFRDKSEWRSYGAALLQSMTGMWPGPGPFSYADTYISQLFAAVTAALATAHAGPKNLEVLVRSTFDRWGQFALQDSAFYVPPRIASSMESLLSNLESLHLTLELGKPWRRVFMLQKFLSLAPNLTWLRLNFMNNATWDDAGLILPWLAKDPGQPVSSAFETPPIKFTRLERFDIGNVNVLIDQVLPLFHKFAPTLRHVSFRRVSLVEKERRGNKLTNSWIGFLKALLKIPNLNLKIIDLSGLHFQCEGYTFPVEFTDPDSMCRSREWQCSASSMTMEEAIERAIRAVDSEFSNPPSVDDDDEGSYPRLGLVVSCLKITLMCHLQRMNLEMITVKTKKTKMNRVQRDRMKMMGKTELTNQSIVELSHAVAFSSNLLPSVFFDRSEMVRCVLSANFMVFFRS